ncbi:hypothetical protein CRUP_020954 [Coryphaenoides rupestris]|nr:hypothetical protein CRUP_020954 [Coryphaenoides rupestris]
MGTRKEEGEYFLKVLIPSYAAGSIIGKGGQTIVQLQKEDRRHHQSCPNPKTSNPGRRRHQPTVAGVEVFGFGQLDGGSGLLLQLDDGLASLPDDGAGCVAGDQHLQEVLAFLCKGEEEEEEEEEEEGVGGAQET